MAAYNPSSSASPIQEYRNPSSCDEDHDDEDEDDDDDEESDIENGKKEEEWVKKMKRKRAKLSVVRNFPHRFKDSRSNCCVRLGHNLGFSSESRQCRERQLIAESLGQSDCIVYGKFHGLFAHDNNSRVYTKTFNRKIGYKIDSSFYMMPEERSESSEEWSEPPEEEWSKPLEESSELPKGKSKKKEKKKKKQKKKKAKTVPKPAPRNLKLPKAEPNLLQETQKKKVKTLPEPAPGNLKMPKGEQNLLQTTQKKTVNMDVERGQEGVKGTRSSRHPGHPETTILDISGIPVQPQDNPVELVKKIGNALGEQIQDCDIDFCLRTTHYTSQLESPITVKFCTKSTKQRLFERWFRKGYLNTLNIGLTSSNPISIRENFCPIYTMSKH